MQKYDHKQIEQKWREAWNSSDVYRTTDPSTSSGQEKPKFYILDMFPYPSGVGLHVGHPKGYIATDIISRYKKMNGYNVLHPMGWDAFGLPAEQYALKNKVHPAEGTAKNIETFKKQLEKISLDYDWEREISTTDPEFYKWTQWAFIQMFKSGLVYHSEEPINWCPSCKTGLANEDLEDGKCERCGSEIEQKPIPQWVIKITDYADRLLEDLEGLDWQESIKEQQRGWIGRSEGAEINFKFKILNFNSNSNDSILNDEIKVFTTRPDTLFGTTYLVLAPEHPAITNYKLQITNWNEVQKYIEQAAKKTEIDRADATREKTGIKLDGMTAVNPANGQEIPIFIADYVLAHYGTGAIMAVPAHDERDYEFAKKFDLPIKKAEPKFEGGKMTTTYRLNDWIFARQRYWGEPIPLVHCEECGWQPVPESELPLVLPEIESYEPTGTGESPLAAITDWVNTKCPKCGGAARRETNTMPQWAGSSWYYLRYIDPKNDSALVDKEKEKYWSPVDFYVGGAEHATRHLIYARFWHKFLYDIGAVSCDEPFKKLQTVGLIMAEDGRKMSKRWGNVINPDDIIEKYGADTLRVYEMFMGPFDQAVAWSTDGLMGPRRFLERVWKLQASIGDTTNEELQQTLHKTIKKVGEDINGMKYNTAISTMMILARKIEEAGTISHADFEVFLKILSPFAPHITQEIWAALGGGGFIMQEGWPEYDESKLVEESVTIAVQVNGKVRAELEMPVDAEEEQVKASALALPQIGKWVGELKPEKVIVVPNKIVNVVI